MINKDLQKKEYSDASKKSFVFKTAQDQHLVMKNTLATYKLAKDNAQSVEYPNRTDLLELYFDIKDDSHLNSVVKHRKTRVTGLDFSLIKSNNSVDDKLTALFNQMWFVKFLDYALDAMFYGNSLVEISTIKGELKSTLIPRENVIPEFKQIKYWSNAQYGDIDYSAPAYAKTLVDVNNNYDSRNLGEYLSISKLVLFKTEVLLNWGQHVEIFGQPIRIATTDSQDPVELAGVMNYLKDLGRSGYLVKNSQTEIEFQESSVNASSSAMYKDFETFINDEISKKILGGTMITDSGSSRSQSEVHERGSHLYTKSDITFIENVINYQLIPVLKHLGFINTKGIEFKFNEPEIITVEEKLEIDRFLIDNFKVKDIAYFEKRYGTGLEFIEKDEEFNDFKQELKLAKGKGDRYDINLNLKDE